MSKAVFLDRDGTIIRDEGYLADPSGVSILPGAVEALRELRDSGFLLMIVTNQSGIGRGFFSEDDMRLVNERVESLFADHGIDFDGILICPHAPDENCDCRKPSPKLLLEAAERRRIDLSLSAMIGDKPSDAECGVAAGCRHNILLTSQPANFADAPFQTAETITEAVSKILNIQH
jgi:D-glycero-D-manno-heptose 1,7-bisphosphate phosphatase